MKKKNVVIIGAGPAGLTAAYKLLKESNDYNVTILEQSDYIGGISRTVKHDNSRMDIGGHRFFSKSKEVMDFIFEIMPIQGVQSVDDMITNYNKKIPDSKIDPNKNDEVMLIRNRYSRIIHNNQLYDYPLKININLFRKMGYINSVRAIFSYVKSSLFKRRESNLENFYINRFGKYLYKVFFENYTEKLWGVHPSLIDPSWGIQRVKGLSLYKAFTNFIEKKFNKKNRVIETSLIESFYYPKLGIGQFYEVLANKILDMGGKIITNSKVIRINKVKNVVKNLIYTNDYCEKQIECHILISSMPLNSLIRSFELKDKKINKIASSLPYRGFIIVGLLLKEMNLVNNTSLKTVSNNIPDHWLYIQDGNVKMGRIQIFNNWSPYIVEDFENNILIGVEYFCNENDDFWNKSDLDLFQIAKEELIKTNIINSDTEVKDFLVEKESKAYPAYFGSYNEIDYLKKYLLNINNLYCVGRNGQHRYNNMDHSIATSLKTVDSILNDTSKNDVWLVNTEARYNE